MSQLNEYEKTLLEGWEDVYKRGAMTFWFLLALRDSSKSVAEINSFIERYSPSMRIDDQSLYRSMRRIKEADLVDFIYKKNESGPDIKIYSLTKTGAKLLLVFAERNISIFEDTKLKSLLN